MTLSKKNLTISIIPLLLLTWGLFIMAFFDPFYSRSSDPEYPYLVNGLNCAILKFNFIGHYDHPGTPFQVFNGIIIRITYWITGKDTIITDVFARPEHYMNAISTSLLLIQVALTFLIGYWGIKRKIAYWQIAILQASFLFNDVLMWLFSRANPDRFFMIAGLIFILIYLVHGYENRNSRKFALWSGTAMALGLATKFNFLPVLLLPLLLIDTNKNRLIYIGSGIASFFIFISPIIDKFDEYYQFLKSILFHDGLYGSGESNVWNLKKMVDSSTEIFKLNLELIPLLVVLIVLTIIAYRKRKEGMREFIFLFGGFLCIIALQILMVSKHFKNYYLTPTFIIYGFMFFTISMFFYRLINGRRNVILASTILPVLFMAFTLVKVKNGTPTISKEIVQHNNIRNFVSNDISKDDFWFVEPTWESGPHVENAIVYGLSYCGHRENYIPQLKAINPNIITYEGNNNPVKLWRGAPVSLDSVVATGKNIYIYSTPGRQAQLLVQMLQETATRNQLDLSIDTVYSDEAQDKILKLKASSPSGVMPVYNAGNARKLKIEGYIQAIKTTPEWLELVKKKALEKNIALDSMILLDAIYMVDNTNK